MSSPEKKRRKKEPEPEPAPTPEMALILSLPYDLLLMCIARVSRLDYPTLSLVSKRFRSLVTSPEIYKIRSLIGRTESCIYVCCQLFGNKPTWFTLCRNPYKTLTNETKSSGYALARVPNLNSPRACFSGLVAVGSKIYNIVDRRIFRPKANNTFSRVSILDCQSHTWSEAPSLQVELSELSATVLDQKIYVAGRYYKDVNASWKNSFQVFDTKTQIWDSLSSDMTKEFCSGKKTLSIDGKVHLVTKEEVVAYDSKEGKWDMVENGKQRGWYMVSESHCVIENVLYHAYCGVLRWYDDKLGMWRDVKGLEEELSKITCHERGIRLADYGGKMLLLWNERLWSGHFKTIWCAEITLERRNNDCEIWGKVEWFDRMLEVRVTSKVVKVLAATL